MSEFFEDGSEQDLIQQMLDKIYPALNDSTSDFYLPNLVKNQGYDPYIVPGGWNWSITDTPTLNAAQAICLDIANDADNWPCSATTVNYILDPTVSVQLTLNGTAPNSGLEIVGLSNVYSELPTVAADGVTITQVVKLSTVEGLAPAMTLNGDFVINLACCCAQTNQKDCLAGTSAAQTGIGTFVATVPRKTDTITTPATATVVFVIKDIAPNVLVVEVQSVTYALPVNSEGNPSINVDITITSSPDAEGFSSFADEAFNSVSGIAAILQNVNTTLRDPNALVKFQNIVTSEIDNYLKENNLYPFNTPSLALH